VLPLLSESKHLTATTTKQTTRTFIGLQWVGFFVPPFYFIFIQVSTTVLHPRHKLQYFEKAGWEEDWIKTSREIVRTEFDQTYAFMDVEEHFVPPPAPSVSFFFHAFT
jgi:hypothetical protein